MHTSSVQLIVTVLSLYAIFRTITMRITIKSRYILLLELCIFLYAVGYYFELDAATIEGAYTAQRIQYLGLPFISIFYFLFMSDCSNCEQKNKWLIALIFVFPVLVLITVNTYPEITLYFKHLSFQNTPTPRLIIKKGILYNANIFYSFFFILLSVIRVIKSYPKKTRSEKQKRIMFMLAAILPFITVFTFVMDNTAPFIILGSASLVVSLFIIGWYIIYLRPQDWLPYAKENIIENLNNGYVLIDTNNNFIDANAVAIGYFPTLKHLLPGDSISDIEGFPFNLLKGEVTTYEFTLYYDEKDIRLRASMTPIISEEKTVCVCVIFYDISEIHRLMEEFEKTTTFDEMTGLLNRTTFFRMAYRDFNISKRNNYVASALMLDIDHFKDVNDHYGHQCGDEVLITVASIIGNRLRHTDISGRYGGEEFCVLLLAADSEAAYKIANIIRQLVWSHQFKFNREEFHVTISIGVAQLDVERHKTLEDLIADADAALYKAKRTSRNKVVIRTYD